MSMSHVNKRGPIFLSDTAALLGIGHPDEEGALYLEFEQQLQITVSLETHDIDSVLMYAEIGDTPGGDEYLRDICQANFLGAGTADAVLALRSDEPIVCIFQRVYVDVYSPQAFLPVLQAFCNVAAIWQQRLRRYA